MNRLLLAGLMVTGAMARDIPAPPPAGELFREWAVLTDTAGARKLFRPAEGCHPVELRGAAVAMPVNFAGNPIDRASWDIAITADMRTRRGVQFDFFCADLAPFSSFSLYFRSGRGWYHASFSPGAAGTWKRVVIDKAGTRVEGEPAGWKDVDTIRLSGWRSRNVDTTCAIANLGPAGERPEVLVLRADSQMARAGSEASGLQRYAATVSGTLDKLGVASAQLADTDLTADLLGKVRLVMLPYNPRVPENTTRLLGDFVKGGGKLMVCYTLDGRIGGILGVRSTGTNVPESGSFGGFGRVGDGVQGQPEFAAQGSWRTHVVEPVEKGRVIAAWRDRDGADTGIPAITLTSTGAFVGHVWFAPTSDDGDALMMALVGELVPELWEQAARKAHAEIGALAGAKDLAGLRARLPVQTSKAVQFSMLKASQAQAESDRLLEQRKWSASVAASGRARGAALRAWCLSRTAQTSEHRAFWCHSAFGLKDKDWDESIRLLKESGFNAILPNMLWAGLAFYPSEVLPVYDGLQKNGDQLAQCLEACRKHGVECHVWKVNWNTGGKAPKAFLERIRAEGRGQKTFAGEDKTGWLCPSHPRNQDLEVASMLEIADRYEVDGIHFDYIRYPGRESCFCDGCRGRFEKVLGRKVAHWPADTRAEGVSKAWLDFRRSNIDMVVRRVAEAMRERHPKVEISAAVFRNWPTDRDGVGQDWKMWCDEGWLDFVCPMDYMDSNALFRNTVEAQMEYAGKVPLYPGIGLSVWKDPKDVVKITEQIEIVRGLGLKGFTVFNYDANAEAVLPYLRLGTTAE